MKVIKRDGRMVDYNRDKIVIAISKANNDVPESEKVTGKQIDKIITNIESLNKKRMLVEDIQDLIELELMKLKKYALAKSYIIYRYNRSLIRKSNNNFESLLSVIKNNSEKNNDNKNNLLINQKDLIAKEVSQDLTKRILLPDKIKHAVNDGYIYFHNNDTFIHPMINSSMINYQDMFNNGYELNNQYFNKPNSFNEAINNLINIINNIYHSQRGGITLNLEHLGEYLKLSEEYYIDYFSKYKLTKKEQSNIVNDLLSRELTNSITNLNNYINNLNLELKDNHIILILYLNSNNNYIDYNAKIIEEIINQKYVGINNKENINKNNSVKLVYVLEDNNINNEKYAYITQEVIECIKLREEPLLLSQKVMQKFYKNMNYPLDYNLFVNDCKTNEGRFNIGLVSLNLVQIALEANKDEKIFQDLLENHLEICYDALMHIFHTLMGTNSNTNPLTFNYGGVSRLDLNDKIDSVLRTNSSLSLGLVGLNEAVYLMKNNDLNDDKGHEYGLSIIKYIYQKLNEWKKINNIDFNLCDTNQENTTELFRNKDIENYELVNELNNYSQSYHCDNQNIEKQLDYQKYFLGGSLITIKTSNINDIINYVYDNITYCKIESEDYHESTNS